MFHGGTMQTPFNYTHVHADRKARAQRDWLSEYIFDDLNAPPTPSQRLLARSEVPSASQCESTRCYSDANAAPETDPSPNIPSPTYATPDISPSIVELRYHSFGLRECDLLM